VLFENNSVKRVIRAETMLERAARQQISEARLHHRAKIAGRVVAKFHHLARRSFKQNNHSLSDVVCRLCHKILFNLHLIKICLIL
jgi:hypothetical protein